MLISRSNYKNDHKLYLENFSHLSFEQVKHNVFPIYNFFRKLDKENPQNLINFNIANEFAVNLFKNKIINYTDIYKIIKKVSSLNLYYPVNTIKEVIKYHEKVELHLQKFKL